MSMNRLRNVAVRMRPPVATPKADAEPPRDAAAAPAPRRVTADTHGTTSKRQIWDIEADEGAAADPRPVTTDSRVRDHVPPTQPRHEPAPIPTPSMDTPSAPSGGRAKTRILGFHAQDLDVDAFDAAEKANKGPQLPAGFLVVIDGPGRGAYFAVSTSVAAIGRGSDQDVALDFGDESISREGHASIVYDEEQNLFFLGHGNKANVVRRNGTPVLTTEELTHGDLIRIGKTSLRFHAFCGEDFTWADTDTEQGAGPVDD